MDVPANLASLSPQELMRIFQDTTRAMSPSDVPTSAQYRTVLAVSTLLAQLDACELEHGTSDTTGPPSTTGTSTTPSDWPHLRALFAHLAALHHRALLVTLAAYQVTPLLALLVEHVWLHTDSTLFLAALEDLLRAHRHHVPFATQCSALVEHKLRTLALPNLDRVVQYKHVAALIVIGLLRQYRAQPNSLNHVLQTAQTLPLLRQYFFAEISPIDRATMTPLAAEMANEFIELARDTQSATALDGALQWLYGLFLEAVPPVTCLITCWTHDHWSLYCMLGALIRQHRARDHPACELFRESVHHVILTRAAELVPLVSRHVTTALQLNVLDMQHVTELLALVDALCGHDAQRQVIDIVTRETAECQHVSSVKFASLADQLRGPDLDHVSTVASVTPVNHAQLLRTENLAEFDAKAIFSSLLSELMVGDASVHERTASLLVGLNTKYNTLRPWMEIEFFNHVTPSHLPRPSTDQYRECLPKKSPFEYDQHVIHLTSHRPHVFQVLAALASPSLATSSKEFLASALAVLTGMWHSVSHLNSVRRLEHVTGDLIACLQSAGMLPLLPLQLLVLSKLASSEVTSLLHTLWTFLSDNDKSKIAAKSNLLIMDNPRLCALSILE